MKKVFGSKRKVRIKKKPITIITDPTFKDFMNLILWDRTTSNPEASPTYPMGKL
jgi:hypothetical protein